VGPIGAVNNGMELLEDEDLGMSDDAVGLAAQSARQAANILQYYRLAYGMAGARIGSDLNELRELAAGYLAASRIELDWTARSPGAEAPEGLGKILLNLVALGKEMLPRGGTLRVELRSDAGGIDAVVSAEGAGAAVREETAPGLAPDAAIEELTPRNVHGYFTRVLARRLGSDLAVDGSTENRVRLAVSLPAAS
jgi:histidine phosphotransferase ChpT